MKDLETIINKLSKNLPELKKRFSIERIGIFGSYSTGFNDEKSDIDILVEFKETPDIFEFIRLKRNLSKLLNRHVDLVTKKAIKEKFKNRILSEVKYLQ
ncbi:MAG: nucleotidyltransferase family protein [Kosmotoga sp.]|nr:MAG: nucleotidyltransferase family protein [Kosmotoga sp.]